MVVLVELSIDGPTRKGTSRCPQVPNFYLVPFERHDWRSPPSSTAVKELMVVSWRWRDSAEGYICESRLAYDVA